MRWHVILRYIGVVFIANAVFLALSASISALHHETAFLALIYSSLVSLLFGIFPLLFVPSTDHISNDEGLVIVVSSWILSCLIGTLPYVLYGGEFSFVNAWFESVSGFTTTGASILSNVEALPAGILFWRACTHWIGGIGIIVFVLSVLPSIGQAAMVLSRSEISPLAKNNFRYRTKTTLRILILVYAGLTLLETISLVLCGMNLFDAVTHSFATIATGGFSTKNSSIAYYNSVSVELVISVFMILSGIHFGLLFLVSTGKIQALFKSTVVRYYVGALFAGAILVAVSIHGGVYDSWPDAFRHASFQVISLGTSSGFATADSAQWPSFAVLIMIYFTLQCACSGSTSGGIKVERILIMLKSIRVRLIRLKHPKAVVSLKFEDGFLNDNTLATSLLFICVYLAVVFLSTLIIAGFGIDIITAFSGSAAAMGNVGPGFGSVSSLANYGHLPAGVKYVLTAVMLLGRLEIFGLILFLTVRFMK
jgi:trk system potassium uptake protein TrkH